MKLSHLFTTAALGFGSITASAQDFPGIGVGDLWAMNSQFDAQMAQANADFCTNWYNDLQAYRAQTGDMSPVNLPFNAMTISNSINQGNQAFQGYLSSIQQGSVASERAVAGFDGYIRGEGTFVDPQTGRTWTAPSGSQLARDWQGNIVYYDSNVGIDPSQYTPVTW